MNAKKRYTATFADGTTVTRTTAREYGVAWRATWTSTDGVKRSDSGFSFNRECAVPYRPVVRLGYGSRAQKAAAKKANAEYLAASGYAVEFAPAVLS